MDDFKNLIEKLALGRDMGIRRDKSTHRGRKRD